MIVQFSADVIRMENQFNLVFIAHSMIQEMECSCTKTLIWSQHPVPIKTLLLHPVSMLFTDLKQPFSFYCPPVSVAPHPPQLMLRPCSMSCSHPLHIGASVCSSAVSLPSPCTFDVRTTAKAWANLLWGFLSSNQARGWSQEHGTGAKGGKDGIA